MLHELSLQHPFESVWSLVGTPQSKFLVSGRPFHSCQKLWDHQCREFEYRLSHYTVQCKLLLLEPPFVRSFARDSIQDTSEYCYRFTLLFC